MDAVLGASPLTGPGLVAARAALARADWQAAFDLASATSPGGADLDDVLAEACWWLGRLDDCIAHRAAAFAGYQERGEHRRAGQCAVWLYEHYCFKNQFAVASGWLQRARRALEGDSECAEYGALALREAEVAHGRGELDRAQALARETVSLARRLASTDLEAEALQTIGRVLIDAGRPAEGLAHFDEAMLFAVEGKLRPYSTGKVYCSLIGACEQLGDLRRAAEWTEATAGWAREHPFAIFPGICRVHRASALTWSGQLTRAEREATRACGELLGLHQPNAGAAYAEVGDIRRRLGDLERAEEAFTRARDLTGRDCAGLALLRLAQGRTDAALRVIEGCRAETGANQMGRARVLSAHAQIAIAAGDVVAAAGSADELAQLADDVGTGTLRALALGTRGRLLLARNEPSSAAATLREAFALWQQQDVPYEMATVGALLGRALRETGNDDAARVHFRAAESLFAQIGATLDARLTQADSALVSAPAGLTGREIEVIRLLAAGATNRQIAAALTLSEKTISRHLSNIFTKIGVSSRAAATAFAYEHGLIRK